MANLTQKPLLASGDTTVVDDTKQMPLGTIMSDTIGNEYVYLQGVASTAIASVVVYDELFVTLLASATNRLGNIAVAMAATVANKFGWYQIRGKATAAVLTGFADNTKIYLSATPGSVDDSGTGGDQIVGMYGRSAVASGVATVQMSYPVAAVDVA